MEAGEVRKTSLKTYKAEAESLSLGLKNIDGTNF